LPKASMVPPAPLRVVVRPLVTAPVVLSVPAVSSRGPAESPRLPSLDTLTVDAVDAGAAEIVAGPAQHERPASLDLRAPAPPIAAGEGVGLAAVSMVPAPVSVTPFVQATPPVVSRTLGRLPAPKTRPLLAPQFVRVVELKVPALIVVGPP